MNSNNLTFKIFYKFIIIISLTIICCSKIGHAQHYVSQDKIDNLRNEPHKYFGQQLNNGEVYLEGFDASNYFSDVMVGFDKLSYSRGDTVNLTISRSGENPKVKQEQVIIRFSGDLLQSSGNLQRISRGHYLFALGLKDENKLSIKLIHPTFDVERIVFTIGKVEHEARDYLIPLPRNLQKGNKNSKPLIEMKYQRIIRIPKDSDQGKRVTTEAGGSIKVHYPSQKTPDPDERQNLFVL